MDLWELRNTSSCKRNIEMLDWWKKNTAKLLRQKVELAENVKNRSCQTKRKKNLKPCDIKMRNPDIKSPFRKESDFNYIESLRRFLRLCFEDPDAGLNGCQNTETTTIEEIS